MNNESESSLHVNPTDPNRRWFYDLGYHRNLSVVYSPIGIRILDWRILHLPDHRNWSGTIFGFSFSYFAHPAVEITSFPVPSVFFVLEKYDNGTTAWVDFVTPAPFLFAASNIPIFVFLTVAPLWLLNSIKRLFGKKARPED